MVLLFTKGMHTLKKTVWAIGLLISISSLGETKVLKGYRGQACAENKAQAEATIISDIAAKITCKGGIAAQTGGLSCRSVKSAKGCDSTLWTCNTQYACETHGFSAFASDMNAETVKGASTLVTTSDREAGKKLCEGGNTGACLRERCLQGNTAACQAGLPLANKNAPAAFEKIGEAMMKNMSDADKAENSKLSDECAKGVASSCSTKVALEKKRLHGLLDIELAKIKAQCDAGNQTACRDYTGLKAGIAENEKLGAEAHDSIAADLKKANDSMDKIEAADKAYELERAARKKAK